MKKLAWAFIIAAALTVANLQALDKQAELRDELARLQEDRERLAGQVEELDRQLRELQASHDFYIAVSEDLSNRLARAEGRVAP